MDKSVKQETDEFDKSPFITPKRNPIEPKKISLNSHVEKFEKKYVSERTVALPKEYFSGNLIELDQKVMSMIVLGHNMIANGKQRASVCQVCGKEGQTSLITDHIEANHLDGITIPCDLCERTFRSRKSLRNHKLHQH